MQKWRFKIFSMKFSGHPAQRLGILARVKTKVTKEKLKTISEAIFMSKVRYGLAVYSKPKFEFNHQEQAMDPNIAKLQVIQNDLLRLIRG